MAKTAVRRVAPGISDEPEAGLMWSAMKAAAEIYWPGLGGKVVTQMQEWNRDLFDGKFRPVPVVLSRMSSVEGHFFPTLDRADQRMGLEGQLVTQVRFYSPPHAIAYVRRDVLLRTMMHQLRRQDGLTPFLGNSKEWCELIMELHRRLTGERILVCPRVRGDDAAAGSRKRPVPAGRDAGLPGRRSRDWCRLAASRQNRRLARYFDGPRPDHAGRVTMSDPRIPKGEPEIWAGAPPHYGPMEYWRPVQISHVELACPNCRRGRLTATGETHEKGNIHACNGCDVKHVVPGEPYPRRVERVDMSAQPMRGTNYANG